jgi:hypothetical protein
MDTELSFGSLKSSPGGGARTAAVSSLMIPETRGEHYTRLEGLASADALGSPGAGTPKAGATSLGLLPQPLELAAVGGGTRQPQLDQVFVEKVLILPVAVRVQVET